MSNELVKIEGKEITSAFEENGLEQYIERIRKEALSHVPDTATSTGRKRIASIAAKVAKSKTYLDSLGKDLVSGIKERAVIIDRERRRMRDNLDALKEEVRRPLTEWEQSEKERASRLVGRVHRITAFKDRSFLGGSEEIKAAIDELTELDVDASFEEFQERAKTAKADAITILMARYITVQKEEKEAQEEKARKEDEQKRLKELEEKKRAERERDIAETARQEERERAEKALLEQKRLAREEANKAEQEKQRAVAAERERIRVEAEKEAAKRSARAADEKRKKYVREHAASDFAKLVDAKTALALVEAIECGEISFVVLEVY